MLPPRRNSCARTFEPKNGQKGSVFWNSEILNSKRPPSYLRVQHGKESPIDRSIKHVMRVYPLERERKMAEVMEGELDTLRQKVSSEMASKKQELRRKRRIRRRCRVRPNEDLNDLEAEYAGYDMEQFEDPAERQPSSPHTSAALFFEGLSGRRHASTCIVPMVKAGMENYPRVGGPCHTVQAAFGCSTDLKRTACLRATHIRPS